MIRDMKDHGPAKAKEEAKMRGFKNKGGILDAKAAFGSNVGMPGKMGEKGNAK